MSRAVPRFRPRSPLLMPLALACFLGLHASAEAGISLAAPGEQTALTREARASYALPIGPWADGAMLTQRTEGRVEQSAWRIDAPGISTLEILGPLRDELVAQGWRILFDCETLGCGGFDFRFSTKVLPEPEMHVDLGDYRFLSAQRGAGSQAEHVSLLVSRTRLAGFVQMIRVAAPDAPATVISTKTPDAAIQPAPKPAEADPGFAARLQAGALVLEDLDFQSGADQLEDGAHAALAALARYLADHPQDRIALVGHTDAAGSLEGNKALSQRRAEAVRKRLLRDHGVAPDRVEAHGIGYLAPRASNQTEEGRAKNRRVEVMLTTTR